MTYHSHSRIRALIQDTNDAFLSIEGGSNTDYADFAGMALSEFKQALRDPNLTRSRLVSLLRKGMFETKHADPDQWSILMAYQLNSATNEDFI